VQRVLERMTCREAHRPTAQEHPGAHDASRRKNGCRKRTATGRNLETKLQAYSLHSHAANCTNRACRLRPTESLISGAGSSCQYVRHMTLHCIAFVGIMYLCLTLFDIALEESLLLYGGRPKKRFLFPFWDGRSVP